MAFIKSIFFVVLIAVAVAQFPSIPSFELPSGLELPSGFEIPSAEIPSHGVPSAEPSEEAGEEAAEARFNAAPRTHRRHH